MHTPVCEFISKILAQIFPIPILFHDPIKITTGVPVMQIHWQPVLFGQVKMHREAFQLGFLCGPLEAVIVQPALANGRALVAKFCDHFVHLTVILVLGPAIFFYFIHPTWVDSHSSPGSVLGLAVTDFLSID
jgi:hypothetical protein